MNQTHFVRALRPTTVALCGLGLALAAGAASAQDVEPRAGNIVFRVGVADVMFNSGAKFRLAGQPVPGADLKLSNNVTAAIEADYYLRRNLSVSLTVGVPPTTQATGQGTLAPLGRLGSVRYGPGVVLAKYHFDGLGRFQPWVGAGVTRMLIFGEQNAAVSNLKIHPSWGGAVQGGAEYVIDGHWGVYASVSRLFLRTHGEGSFSGLPVSAKIAMDPTVFLTGLSFRY